MVEDDEVVDEVDIEVGHPHGGEPTTEKAPDRQGTGGIRGAADLPFKAIHDVRGRYRRLPNRDKFVVLTGILVLVIAIAVVAIWMSAGGVDGDGDGDGPEIVRNWKFGEQQFQTMGDQEENTNLEGQETIYPVAFQPNLNEVYKVTKLTGVVTWSDESTPPAQVPAIGYDTNEPDGFQLIFRIHDGMGEMASGVVFNAQGQQGEIPLEWELENPIYVANPQGAKYLPEGYVGSLRIDLIVRTDECGDWPPPDPLRPTIGDGGNHYVFDWSIEYYFDDDGKP